MVLHYYNVAPFFILILSYGCYPTFRGNVKYVFNVFKIEEGMMRKIIRLISPIVLFACYITFLTIFAVAYFDYNKVITIGIDVYGEAHLEAVILLISIPLCVKYLWEQLKSL